MAKRARKSSKSSSGGAAKAEFQVWVNRRTRSIHIASKSAKVISTVNDKPGNKRCHENLYGKLRAFLKREGRWPDGL